MVREGPRSSIAALRRVAAPPLAWIRRRPVLLALLGYFAVGFIQFPAILRGEVVAPVDLLTIAPPWSVVGAPHPPPSNPLRSDIVDSWIPVVTLFGERVRGGDLPLWNDTLKQGLPFFQFIGNGLLHPVNWLWVVLPPEDAMNAMMLVKVALLGIGMYALLRQVGASPAAAFIGGAIYQFQGFNVAWLFWPQTLVTAAAPLFLAALLYHWRRPSARATAGVASAAFLLLAGGFPSIAGYAVYAGIGWCGTLLARDVIRRREWREVAGAAAGAIAGVALGAGMLAIQLLPTLEMFSRFDVLEARSGIGVGYIDPSGLKQILLPFYYGNSAFYNYDGPVNFNEAAAYAGWVGAALAALGAGVGLWRRQLMVALLLLTGLVSGLIVYGFDPDRVRDLLVKLPVLGDNPNNRQLAIVGLAVSGLAGLGADALLTRKPVRRIPGWAIAGVAGLPVLGVLAWQAGWVADHHVQVGEALISYPTVPVTLLGRAWLTGMTFVAAGMGAVVLAVLFHAPRRSALIFALVLLVVADGRLFSIRQNAVVSADTFYPVTDGIAFLQENSRPGDRILAFDGALFPLNVAHAYGLSSAIGHSYYSPAHKRLLTAMLGERLFRTPTATIAVADDARFARPAFRLLGARYFVFGPNRRQDAERAGTIVYAGPDLLVAENPRFERAWLPTRIDYVSNEAEALAALDSAKFDPARTVVVVGTAADAEYAPGGTEELVEYDPGRQLYRVSSEEGGMLTVSDIAYPGWEATVDGESTPVEAVNLVYRGVRVGPGEHTVELVFRPASFRTGALLSLGSLMVVVGLLTGSTWYRPLRRAASRVGVGSSPD